MCRLFLFINALSDSAACYDRLRENVFQGVMYEKYCNGSKAGMATEIIEQVLAAWSEGKETEVV